MDVGEREPQRRRARMRQLAGGEHDEERDQPQGDERQRRGGDEDRGNAPVVSERDGERGENRNHRAGGQDIRDARPASLRRNGVAEQGRDRNVMRAPERPQGEGERGEQSENERQREPAGIQRRLDGDGNDVAENRDDGEGQGRADDEPDGRADGGDQQHLREIDQHDARAGGAERFHRGNGVALAVEMAFHRVGDADAADQQGRQSDQREILREALDIALELRRGVVAGADFPAGIGKLPRRIGRDRRGRLVARGVVGQPDAVMPAHQASRLQRARSRAEPPRS